MTHREYPSNSARVCECDSQIVRDELSVLSAFLAVAEDRSTTSEVGDKSFKDFSSVG